MHGLSEMFFRKQILFVPDRFSYVDRKQEQ